MVYKYNKLSEGSYMDNSLYIVMYHYIKDFTNPLFKNLKGLDADLFDKQLEFFSKNFNVLSMEETIEIFSGGGGNFKPNSLLLTFDDGYYCHYSAAYPILKKHNMQGSFFIPAKVLDKKDKLLSTNKIHLLLASTDINEIYGELYSILVKKGFCNPEELMKKYLTMNRYDDHKTVFIKTILQNLDPLELRENLVDELFKKFVDCDEAEIAKSFYMNKEQIKQMQNDGMYIGLHGYRHDRLGNMTNSEIKEDIDKALDICNEFINPNCWVMNYPFGHANQNVVDYVSKKGACFGITTEPKIANLNYDNKYLLPRLDCNDFPPKSENYKTDKVKRELCVK